MNLRPRTLWETTHVEVWLDVRQWMLGVQWYTLPPAPPYPAYGAASVYLGPVLIRVVWP